MIAVMELKQIRNYPQPLDNHVGNTYGANCYRSPWKRAGFKEPTLVMSGWKGMPIHNV